MGLTRRQLEVYEVIREYRFQAGVNPTAREVAEIIGVGQPRVVALFKALLRKGAVRYAGRKGQDRNYEPVEIPIARRDVERMIEEMVEDVELAGRLKQRVKELPKLLSEVYVP